MDLNFRLPSADMVYSSEIQRTATNAAMTRKFQITYRVDCRESGKSGRDYRVALRFLGAHCSVTPVTESRGTCHLR